MAFVMPVLNGSGLLKSSLQTIKAQDYPSDKLELIVADGGSMDDSAAVARSFGAEVITNPLKLAEPGVDLAIKKASADIVFVMASDNGLPRPDWTRLMVKPFIDRPDVVGAYTHIVPAPEDNGFTRYYCKLHVEPFTWFVYGDACNPRYFDRAYRRKFSGDGYVVHEFSAMKHPLLAFAQGFGLRRNFVRRQDYEHDDILPVIQMIEEGKELAYVPGAGVYHHHLESFTHYVKKYTWRIGNSLNKEKVGFDRRGPYLSRWRIFRKYLFEFYGLSVVFPLFDSIRLAVRERDTCMLWHGPASIGLSWVILGLLLRRLMSGRGGVK